MGSSPADTGSLTPLWPYPRPASLLHQLKRYIGLPRQADTCPCSEAAGLSVDYVCMPQEPSQLISGAALVNRQWHELATCGEALQWRLLQPMPKKLAYELVRNFGGLRPWPSIWAKLRPSNLLQSLAEIRSLSPMHDSGASLSLPLEVLPIILSGGIGVTPLK